MPDAGPRPPRGREPEPPTRPTSSHGNMPTAAQPPRRTAGRSRAAAEAGAALSRIARRRRPRRASTAISRTRPRSDRRQQGRNRDHVGRTSREAAAARGGISRLAAGIIGGVIALVGAGGLQFAGLLGAPGSGAGVSLDGVNGEIAALKSEIAALKEAGGSARCARPRWTGFRRALDQVKADVAALKSAVESGGAATNAGLRRWATRSSRSRRRSPPWRGRQRARRSISARSTKSWPASTRW